jgi:hypothetical protein
MAMATGTLVVRCLWVYPVDGNYGQDHEQALQQGIDNTTVLRRVGEVTSHKQVIDERHSVIELRCDVEYGPVFGCHESDLVRQLKSIVQETPLKDDAQEAAVFNFVRRELSSVNVAEVLSTLEAKLEDVRLPLKARKNVSNTITRLREHFPVAQ